MLPALLPLEVSIPSGFEARISPAFRSCLRFFRRQWLTVLLDLRVPERRRPSEDSYLLTPEPTDPPPPYKFVSPSQLSLRPENGSVPQGVFAAASALALWQEAQSISRSLPFPADEDFCALQVSVQRGSVLALPPAWRDFIDEPEVLAPSPRKSSDLLLVCNGRAQFSALSCADLTSEALSLLKLTPADRGWHLARRF